MSQSLDEVQPVDGYVKSLLKSAMEKYNLKINLDNPTRGQRLEAALAMKNEDRGWYSMEIMVGRRVDSSEQLGQTLAFLTLAQALHPTDPREFYGGFAHAYWPEKK